MQKEIISREEINKRFGIAFEFLLRTSVVDSQKQFAESLEETSVTISQIKASNRNASIMQLCRLINKYGLNANYFLKADNSRETIDDPKVVNKTTSQRDFVYGNVSKHVDTIYGNYYNYSNTDRLLENATPELKEHVKDLENKYNLILQQYSRCQEELNETKKIIDNQTSQIQDYQAQLKEKDKQLYKAQERLIEIMMKERGDQK